MSDAYQYDPGELESKARLTIKPSEIARVVAEVAAEHGVDPSDMRSRSRHRKNVLARREAWRRLARPNVSISDLSKKWPCNHTSVLEAIGRRQSSSNERREAAKCNSSASPG